MTVRMSVFVILLACILLASLVNCRNAAPSKTRDLVDAEVGIEGNTISNLNDVFDDEEDEEDEEDEDEVEEEEVFVKDNIRRSVEVINHYTDKVVTVYWQGATGDSVKMNDIQPSRAISLNTFNGHQFYASEENDPAMRLMEENVGFNTSCYSRRSSHSLSFLSSPSLCIYMYIYIIFSLTHFVLQFVIRGDQMEYHIRPSDAMAAPPVRRVAKQPGEKGKLSFTTRPKGTMHPAIKRLNSPTTSMNAKFR